MRFRGYSARLKRGVAGLAISAAAIGTFVGVSATPASAASVLTVTSVTCTGTPVYGSTFSCTISVVSLNIFSSNRPTGTASLDTLLGRLSSTSCTLAPAAATRTSSCTVTPTALDTGIVFPGATYSGSGTYFGSVGAMISPLFGLVINPAPLTITADSTNRDYGDSNPAFTAGFDSFVNGDDQSDLVGTLGCTTIADENSPVGDYDIDCSGLSSPNSAILPFTPHYSLTWESGTLTVDKVPLVVTGHDENRAYGEANPAFTAGYDGFVNGDDEGDLGGTLECSTVADENSPVGEYDIECSGLTSDNYAIVFEPGTLKVLSAPDASLPGGDGAVEPGGELKIEVTGWEPGSTVHVDACGEFSGDIVVDENGDGEIVFTVPADFDATECEITLSGNDQTGNPAEIVVSFAGAIPTTGSNVFGIGMAALFTCLAGAMLLLLGRRRLHFGH